MTSYVHLALLALLVAVFSWALLALTRLFGPQRSTPAKGNTYEGGIPARGHLRGRTSVKFFRVAVLFLLFNLGVILLYPWAIQQKRMGSWTLWFVEGMLFLAMIMVAWLYAMKSGVLNWGSDAGPERE